MPVWLKPKLISLTGVERTSVGHRECLRGAKSNLLRFAVPDSQTKPRRKAGVLCPTNVMQIFSSPLVRQASNRRIGLDAHIG